MENKYYTPSIEEFHMGFEYQFAIDYYEDGKLFPKEHEDSWLSDDYDGTDDLSLIELKIEGKNIRVKHLDSNDLKDLGWAIEIEDENMIKAMIDIPYEHEGATLHGKWEISFGKDRYCFIYEDLWGKTGFFRGVIKNKSELKKLMKQLDIL